MYRYKIEAGQSSVNPIRDPDDLYNCINYYKKLRDTSHTAAKRKQFDRNYMLILVGIVNLSTNNISTNDTDQIFNPARANVKNEKIVFFRCIFAM